jgi:hypothetical protein
MPEVRSTDVNTVVEPIVEIDDSTETPDGVAHMWNYRFWDRLPSAKALCGAPKSRSGHDGRCKSLFPPGTRACPDCGRPLCSICMLIAIESGWW